MSAENSKESRMKSRRARAESGLQARAKSQTETTPASAGSEIRIEDLCDGSARVSLRLPWPLVLQVLDLASAGVSAASRRAALT
jgi:hypothetical protein